MEKSTDLSEHVPIWLQKDAIEPSYWVLLVLFFSLLTHFYLKIFCLLLMIWSCSRRKRFWLKLRQNHVRLPTFDSVLTVPLIVCSIRFFCSSTLAWFLLSPTSAFPQVHFCIWYSKKSLSHLSLFTTWISHACLCGLMSHTHEEVFNWYCSGHTERGKLNPKSRTPD